MIHIKYYIFNKYRNSNVNKIQISDHKENSFKIIKKIKNKTDHEEIQEESNYHFKKNKDYVSNFKNFKTMTIEIMIDNFPKNIIRFST